MLPILHLNGYKIANPTVLARIPEEQLLQLIRGWGWDPIVVAGDDPMAVHRAMAEALDTCLDRIAAIQEAARSGSGPRGPAPWPMIVMRTPKGWTGPKVVDGKQIEGTFRAHQVPLSEVRTNEGHLAQLEAWMRSYRPRSCSTRTAALVPDLQELAPRAIGGWGRTRTRTAEPSSRTSSCPTSATTRSRSTGPASTMHSATTVLGDYLRDVMAANPDRFRLMGPDETASNRLQAVFGTTDRAWQEPILPTDDHLAPDGRVMEVLSEHLLQGWLEGYLLTGRHGLMSSYEAFAHIVDSMVNQHAKWLHDINRIEWRRPIASLNYLITSHVWRQDHNGSSHQDPGFIDHVVNKKAEIARVYLPPDANCLLSVGDHALRSRQYINVIVAGKQEQLDYLTMDEAIAHCTRGLGIWEWASTTENEPDVVLAAAGEIPTMEVLAAADLLRQHVPDLKVRVVNVVDLMRLQSDREHPHGLPDREFDAIFTAGQAGDLRVPRLPAAHPPPHVQAGEPRPVPRPRVHRGGHHHDAVRHGDDEPARPVLARVGRHRPGAVARHRVRRAAPADRDARLAARTYTREHGEDDPSIANWRWPYGRG